MKGQDQPEQRIPNGVMAACDSIGTRLAPSGIPVEAPHPMLRRALPCVEKTRALRARRRHAIRTCVVRWQRRSRRGSGMPVCAGRTVRLTEKGPRGLSSFRLRPPLFDCAPPLFDCAPPVAARCCVSRAQNRNGRRRGTTIGSNHSKGLLPQVTRGDESPASRPRRQA